MQIEDGFYKGVVIDNNDEFRRGRVRVRIEGLHEGFKDDNIKWAEVIQPTFMGILGGTGACSVLRIGTGVWIKFDKDFDHPVVVGVLVGGTEEHTNLYDSKLPISDREGADWGTEAIPKNCNFRYGSLLKAKNHVNTVQKRKYLTTTTLETPGGHLIELDDSPNTPAIRITHSSGLSQITLNEDGSICILGHTVNVTSAQKMTFESLGDISVEAKGSIYVKSGQKTAIQAGNGVNVKSDNEVLINSKNNISMQSTDGDLTMNVAKGCMVATSKDTMNLESKNKVVMTGSKETKIQGGQGSATLSNSTTISSSGGKVAIQGNACAINTKLDVANGVSTNGMITGTFMLAKDFLPCIMPSTPSTSLMESYNNEMQNRVQSINESIEETRNIKDLNIKINNIKNIKNKIDELDNDFRKVKGDIHKSILEDFIRQHKESFEDINENEIQMLCESTTRAMSNIGGLSVTNRTPDGTKKIVEKSSCPCDWLSPGSWFEIDGIDEFTVERFSKILEYDIKLPDLNDIFPPTPQFSLMALIKIVMKIAAMKIIKMVIAFKRMVMQYIRPVIDAINNAIAIINAIPPKIDFNLDLGSLLGNPLFNFPDMPDSSMPNICCTVSECTCCTCPEYAEKVGNWQKEAEDWAEENLPEGEMPNIGENIKNSLPSGYKKEYTNKTN